MAQLSWKVSQKHGIRAFGLAIAVVAMSLPLAAQGDLAAIQQQLQERITLATLDSNGEIVTAGSVITLQKSSLQMCGTGSPANAGAPANTYKNGKLSAGMFSWTLGLGLAHVDLNSIPMHTFAAGDKFWVVRINVKKNGVEFKLWTDPDANNLRYWGWLEVPFPKNQIPSPDEVMNTVAEVLSVDNQGVQQAAVPGPAVAPGPTQDTGSGISGKYLDRGNKRDFLMLGQLCVFRSMWAPDSIRCGHLILFHVGGDSALMWAAFSDLP